MKSEYLFTSESVSPGHPDKMADVIADTIVDFHLMNDENARIASEVFVAGDKVVIGGEVTSKTETTYGDYKRLVDTALKTIGYDNSSLGFNRKETLYPEDVQLHVFLNQQSPDINQGVDREDGEVGAGDQGIMFGYAAQESDDFMPAAINLSRKLCTELYEFAKREVNYGLDIKTQVTVDYGDKESFLKCDYYKIHTIVASMPSERDIPLETVRETVLNIIKKTFELEGAANKTETGFILSSG